MPGVAWVFWDNKHLRIIISLLCFVWGIIVSMDSSLADELPSVVSLEWGGDDYGNRDSYLSLDYALPGGARLLFSAGSTRSDSEDNPLTVKSSLLGFRSNPLSKFSGGVDFEHWGDKESLTTDTFRMVFELNLDKWLISLRPQWRTLTFITDCVAPINCDPEVEVQSTGTAIDVNYFFDSPWGLSLGYVKHEYDRKVEALYQYPVFDLIFSATTMDLAAGIEDYRNSIGVSYVTMNSVWSLSRIKTVSKVSAVTTIITTLRFSTDINESWRLLLRIGSQANEDKTERIGFAGAGFSFSW